MADHAGDLVGKQLGNYRLIRLLGKGGFAEVYLGEHIYLKTQAAIKALHIQLTDADLQDFLTEARTIARLKHPHIVRVLEFGMENETPFLVMDYAPNGTLRHRHRKGVPVPLATVITYVRQVAEALQYAHNEKLIHRDVKPGNMLVGQEEEILLSDFGTAIAARSAMTQISPEMVGTMAYIAPEQLQGKPTFASDQYALGMVTYEWLSGDRPFRGTVNELARQHLHVPPPSLQEKVPDIPPAVEEVIMTAVEKDPKNRFPSVRSFADALERVSSSEEPTIVISPSSPLFPTLFSTLSAKDSPTPPAGEATLPLAWPEGRIRPSTPITPASSMRENRVPKTVKQSSTNNDVSTGGLSAMDAAGLPTEHLQLPITPVPDTVGIPLVNTASSSAAAPRTKRRFSRRMVIGGLAGLAVVGGSGIAWLLFSRKIERVVTRISGANTPAPTVRPVPKITLYIYHGHAGWVNSVAWSPNGARIASGSADHTVQVWNALTGAHPFTYRGHAAQVRSVAWSPDGKRIASAGRDRTVQVWDAITGGQIFTYHGHNNAVNSVTWSPDEKSIASASTDHTVQVWDAATGNQAYIYRGHSREVNAVAWSPNGKTIASASTDKTVQVWDAVTGNHILTYSGHTGIVRGIAWSPDGTRLVSGSDDGTAQVWNATSGHQAVTYFDHTARVNSVAWSPDGMRIASASADHTVQVWDAASGDTVFTYRGHTNGITTVAWSADGKYIVSGGTDRTAQMWNAP